MSNLIQHTSSDSCRCTACLDKHIAAGRPGKADKLQQRYKQLVDDEGWSPKEARLLALEGM